VAVFLVIVQLCLAEIAVGTIGIPRKRKGCLILSKTFAKLNVAAAGRKFVVYWQHVNNNLNVL
jgi:hypothetical protein